MMFTNGLEVNFGSRWDERIMSLFFYQDAAVSSLDPLVRLIVLCHSHLPWKDRTLEI
jgi:hypothetical protein